MLKWVTERLDGTAAATETPIGRVPTRDSLDTDGLDISEASLDLLLTVDVDTWREEAALVRPHYERFGDHVPAELWAELDSLNQRLGE